MNRGGLRDFLVAAKTATYASQGDEASVLPLLPGTRQLEYRQGRHLYRDVYVGTNRFSGQEIVYVDGEPVWSMAYAGGVVGVGSPARVYAFLQHALRLCPSDKPFRGPDRFEEDGAVYVSECAGDIQAFHGRESIDLDGIRAYELIFAGGVVA